jgi:hypothetical protein
LNSEEIMPKQGPPKKSAPRKGRNDVVSKSVKSEGKSDSMPKVKDVRTTGQKVKDVLTDGPLTRFHRKK